MAAHKAIQDVRLSPDVVPQKSRGPEGAAWGSREFSSMPQRGGCSACACSSMQWSFALQRHVWLRLSMRLIRKMPKRAQFTE